MIVIYCFRIINNVGFNNHNHKKHEKTKLKKLTYFYHNQKRKLLYLKIQKPIFINKIISDIKIIFIL